MNKIQIALIITFALSTSLWLNQGILKHSAEAQAVQITICHLTNRPVNPYNKITVSSNSEGGHFDAAGNPLHGGDLLFIGNVDCPTSTPTPTPSPTPTATPTTTPTPTPTPNGNGTPTPSPRLTPTPTPTPTPPPGVGGSSDDKGNEGDCCPGPDDSADPTIAPKVAAAIVTPVPKVLGATDLQTLPAAGFNPLPFISIVSGAGSILLSRRRYS